MRLYNLNLVNNGWFERVRNIIIKKNDKEISKYIII